jgi:hypothetical protein
MPIGKNNAPATRNPHDAVAKQVKICVSQAAAVVRRMAIVIISAGILFTPNKVIGMWEDYSFADCPFFNLVQVFSKLPGVQSLRGSWTRS